ncbi:MAG: 50S ribosomal protein L29 [Saprospiraceae bacterium]|nr:50S ribosomal protein L29 [Saprospiraceae bacterium]
MATKKYIELQEFTDENLANEIEETVKQLTKVKFDHSVKGLDNPLVIREIRRDIARLKSEQRRREVAAMSAEQVAKRSKIRERRK